MKDWTDAIPWAIALAGFVFGVIQYARGRKRKKQEKKAELEAEQEFKQEIEVRADRTAEEIYCDALREELGTIHMLGSPDIESKTVKLEDAFVSLRISESWRSDTRFETHERMTAHEGERHLTPEEVMKRAFQKYKLLLVIGDPGSGKTTLLKFYAMHCLDEQGKKCRRLGFPEEVMPLFFPLRELEYQDDEPLLLPQNLAKWSEKHLLNIPGQQFHTWLHKRKTLVLLDGLDEISSKIRRQKVCGWIKNMCTGLKNARFVVTSRATGYRKLDGIELQMSHLRADIMDFSAEQQEAFLKKWFRAVCLAQLPPKDMPEQEWKVQQEKRADQRSLAIIDFLAEEDNKAVQELAAVPMLLQIMAILWKDREHLPRTRPALYDAALNYLLEFRDRQKGIEPVLPSDEARRVLAPTALWMQEELKKDEAPKEGMHAFMQPILNTLVKRPEAKTFCENLRDRAGLIADYDPNHYIFRHKSFREFLSGIQLKEDCHQPERIESLIGHFKEDWWEETLRFFMSKSNDKIFDDLMHLFFQSDVSRQLDDNQQTLLLHLVKEAPQRKIDALKEWLNSDQLNNNQRQYVLDCLKAIGSPEAMAAIKKADKREWSKDNRSYAEDMIAEAATEAVPIIEKTKPRELFTGASFRNPFEDNVEYIRIPGGTYKFSVPGRFLFFKFERKVTVPDLYFCKYPVTNKRYRRFISYLGGKEKEFQRQLPLDVFEEKLLEFANTPEGYRDYLGPDPAEWGNKLRSRYDIRNFNGDDQPVVAVIWYAARAYCFWLSCLEAVINRGDKLEKGDVNRVALIYRLPTEMEWEWAAGGNSDGSVREYPWPENKGGPNPTLANYSKNVGYTTPVGRYPEGATPLGLMDMAGNAREWMENWYDYRKNFIALRGGSWYDGSVDLRCVSRDLDTLPDFWNNDVGFRVVALPAPSHTD